MFSILPFNFLAMTVLTGKGRCVFQLQYLQLKDGKIKKEENYHHVKIVNLRPAKLSIIFTTDKWENKLR